MQSRVSSLDGLRGLAALLVVMTHVQVALGWFPEMPGLFNGILAVNIFFILSGYVLTLSIANISSCELKLEKGRFRPFAYSLQRFVRLWVPYICALLLALALRQLMAPEACGDSNLISNAYCERWLNPYSSSGLYEQVKGLYSPHFLAPSWTLPVELANSLLIPLCVLAFRASPLYLLLLALISVSDLFFTRTLPATFYMFALGTAAAFLPSMTKIRMWSLPVFVLSYLFFVPSTPFQTIVPFLLTPAAFVAVQIALNSKMISSFLSKSLFVGLGTISFSMYLLHWPLLIGLLPKIASWLQVQFPFKNNLYLQLASLVVYFVILAITSVAFYELIDKFAIQFGRLLKRKVIF